MKQKVELSKCFQFGNIEALDSFLKDITRSEKEDKELSSFSGHNLYAIRNDKGFLVARSGNPLDKSFRNSLKSELSNVLKEYKLSEIKVDILCVYNIEDEHDYENNNEYNIIKRFSDQVLLLCEPMALSCEECKEAFCTVIDSSNNGKVKGHICSLALLNDYSERTYTKIFRIFAYKNAS